MKSSLSLSLSLLNSRKSKTVLRLALIFFGVGFLVFGAGVKGAQAVTDVTLTSPSSGESFQSNETIDFVGNVDTGGDVVTDVSLVVRDADGNYVVQETTDEYFKQYQSTGSTVSAVHYDEYLESDIVLNPTYIIDNNGNTCGGINSPCNVFDSVEGNSLGGYWSMAGTSSYATMTFDDLYEISSFSVVQHSTYYGRHLKLEYRTSDISSWVTLYDDVTTVTKTVNFVTPVFARYFKMTYSDFNSTHLYVPSVNVLGKHASVVPIPYDGPVEFSIPNTFGGGTQQWNLRVNDEGVSTYATADGTFFSDNTHIEFSAETPAHGSTQSRSVIGSEVTSDFDYLKLFDVGESLRSWFSFNEATNRNYGDTGTLSNTGVKSSTLGVAGHVGDSIRTTRINGLDDILNGEFTFVVSAIIPLASDGNLVDFGISGDGLSGFKMRLNRINATRDTLDFLRYNGSGYAGANTVTIDNPTRDQWTRYAISVDILNKKVRFFRNGAYLGEQTFTTVLDPRDYLIFGADTGKYYDEIVVLDRFVSSAEGISLTKLTGNDLDLGVTDCASP